MKMKSNQFFKSIKETKISTWFLFVGFTFLISACNEQEKGKVYQKPDGAWTAELSSAQSVYVKYLVEIDKVKTSSDVYIISNFNNLGISEFVYANLRGDSLFIENQSISGIFIDGKGKFNKEFNHLDITYKTDNGSMEIVYFGRFSR
jgi:hypothetical protein